MSQKLNLKELERKAYRSYFQDGLWDIFLGLLLLAMSVHALLSDLGVQQPWYTLMFMTVQVPAILVLVLGKKYITVPRMGLVKFGPARRAGIKKTKIAIFIGWLIVMVMLLAAALATRSGLLPSAIGVLVFAITLIAIFSLIAYFMDFARLYLYGVLFGVTIPVDFILEEIADVGFSGPIAFGVPAAIVLLMGTVVFIRFLRQYPLPTEEGDLQSLKKASHDNR